MSADTAARSGWLLRLKPDEDLVEALTEFAAAQGLASLRMIGAVGSLMHATLRSPDGATQRIDGPGIEIVTFGGTLDALQLVVADTQGRVYSGAPEPGGNPICVTIELFVQAEARA